MSTSTSKQGIFPKENTITNNSNPVDFSQRIKDTNPAPHGFNKASRKQDPRTWGGDFNDGDLKD